MLFPIIYEILNSFMSPDEVSTYYNAVIGKGNNPTVFHMLPDKISLISYYKILLQTPSYLTKFFNSLLLCIAIVVLQLIVACMGGYAFAKYNFKGKSFMYIVLLVLMVLPIQVTLVPSYILLDKLNILNTWWALILPSGFSPFGIFLLSKVFKSIPTEVIQAAQLDGANTFNVITKIILPFGKGGIICTGILGFIDAWNMVEQPITFLRDSNKYPLSVFLTAMNTNNFSLSFVCGILTMIPVLFIFLYFKDELIEGIEFSGIK